MAADDHIPKLYEEVGDLKTAMAAVQTEMHGVSVTLLSIRDQLKEASKTPWAPIVGGVGIAITIILAGVGAMMSVTNDKVTSLEKDLGRQVRSLERDVEGHESDLDRRAYLTEAFDLWRSEQRVIERRLDAVEKDVAVEKSRH